MSDDRTPDAPRRWHADDSQNGLANLRVQFIAADSRLLCAIAIAVSVICAFYSFEAGREMAQKVYWDQRIESFLEQLSSQGLPVPKDILDHIKKEHGG